MAPTGGANTACDEVTNHRIDDHDLKIIQGELDHVTPVCSFTNDDFGTFLSIYSSSRGGIDGRDCCVTMAKNLARNGYNVLVHGRDEKRIEQR